MTTTNTRFKNSAKKNSVVSRVFDQEQVFKNLQGEQPPTSGINNDVWEDDANQKAMIQLPLNLQMLDPHPTGAFDNRGPLIVPFFPTHWQENSNNIFNNDFVILENAGPDKHQAALSPMKYDTVAPALLAKMTTAQKSKQENERPTSGKHF